MAHNSIGVIMMTLSTIPRFRRGYRMQWEETQQQHVILYPEGMAKLNESAAMILELVDGESCVATIIDKLNQRFPEAGGIDEDVIDFLQAAYLQKWIMVVDAN